MEDATVIQLSYTAWRTEASRISELALRINKDERLTPLIVAVTSDTKAPTTATAPATPMSSFFSQLFSSSSNSTNAPPALPWSAKLAQLLSLAELPASNTQQMPTANEESARALHYASSATAATSVKRRFGSIIAAVAESSSTHPNKVDGHVEGHTTLVSSSHAVLPMQPSSTATSRTGISANTKSTSALHSSFGARLEGSFGQNSTNTSVRTDKETSCFDDDNDDEDRFDRMFARLKQQAAERSQQLLSTRIEPTAQSSSPTFAAAPTPAASATSSLAHAGLAAARAALDAADALLLRLRQQSQFSTTPSGRITEAQTLVVRATVCREAQLYTEIILNVVQILLQRHYQAQEMMMVANGKGQLQRQSSVSDKDNGALLFYSSHQWAACVTSTSPEHLNYLLRAEQIGNTSSSPQRSSTALSTYTRHVRNGSFDCRGDNSPQRMSRGMGSSRSSSGSSSSNAAVTKAAAAKKNNTSEGGSQTAISNVRRIGSYDRRARTPPRAAATRSESTRLSPTSASSTNFYHFPRSPSMKTTSFPASPVTSTSTVNASHLLPADLMLALHQWKQFVGGQQRALRCAEVNAYLAAGQLFMGAAAERAHLGSFQSEVSDDNKDNNDGRSKDNPSLGASISTTSAGLASHGVTHLLRACGLLLTDPFLEQEIAFPASLLSEMNEMLALQTPSATVTNTTAKQEERAASSPVVITPPLLASPHATRVWMLLAKLATFIERHRLQLPWDIATPAAAIGASSSTSSPATSTPLPPVAHRTASPSTVQLLWEVSTAVLLFDPLDALHTMQTAVSYTSQIAKPTHPAAVATAATAPSSRPPPKSEVSTSLHELFHEYMQSPSATTTTELGSTPAQSSRRLVVQPGTLPLSLLSLRHASAAAVRARHYAEALRDVEVALYLLHTASTSASEANDQEETNGMENQTRRSVIDYGKVNYWPLVCTSAPAETSASKRETFINTATCLSALANFNARIHFLLMRLLLLLLASPLMAGDAAARMLRQGELFYSAHISSHKDTLAKLEKMKGKPAIGAEDDESSAKETSPFLSKSMIGVPADGEVKTAIATQRARNSGWQQKASTAAPTTNDGADQFTQVASITTTLQRTLRALQMMTDQMLLLEEEGLILKDEVFVTNEKGKTAAGTRSATYLVRYMPRAEYRLSNILRSAAASTAEQLRLSGVEADLHSVQPNAKVSQNDFDPLVKELSVSDKDQRSETPYKQQICTLTSSVRYQQLKQKHQARQRPRSVTEAVVADKETPETLLERKAPKTGENEDQQGTGGVYVADLAAASFVNTSGKASQQADRKERKGELSSSAEDESNTSSYSQPVVSSEALHNLQQLVRELLTIVCFLTLPLRAASTCTLTCETALPLPRYNVGAPNDVNAAYEGDGYDREYMQARRELGTFAHRLGCCLRQLGARDRTLFTLVRRLQVELLFPSLCGPPL